MFRILFVLPRGPEADAAFSRLWNLTDRLFKLFQWLFFMSLVTYAANKTRNIGLIVISAVLWGCLLNLTHSFYRLYIEMPLRVTLGLSWPKLLALESVVISIVCVCVGFMCLWTIGVLGEAFEYYQAHH